jgi:chromate reductase, NAD(P)H dehydrogenase (quinone)
MSTLKILAIPGSLRPTSSSNTILKQALKMFPGDIKSMVYNDVGNLPHFNDSNDTIESVNNFRSLIQSANGVLICQPEYAFGVAGSLKNALDWTVGSGEFVDKPVALITAATGGENAHAAMQLILTAMNSIIVKDATLVIPFVKAKLDAGEY